MNNLLATNSIHDVTKVSGQVFFRFHVILGWDLYHEVTLCEWLTVAVEVDYSKLLFFAVYF